MIVLVLMAALAGSAIGSIALWVQGAPWWQIALGYVGGGWAGLLLGLPVLYGLRRLWQAVHQRPEPGRARSTARAPAPERCRGSR